MLTCYGHGDFQKYIIGDFKWSDFHKREETMLRKLKL